MAKICINPVLLASKRCYGVAAENGRLVGAAAGGTVVKKEAEESAAAASGEAAGKGNIFWMRDPKTGNWVPENTFGDDITDAVELRKKFLSNAQKNL